MSAASDACSRRIAIEMATLNLLTTPAMLSATNPALAAICAPAS